MTVMLPLGNLAFALPVVPGYARERLRLTDLIGLVVIVAGLLSYRFGQEILVKWHQRRERRSSRREPLLNAHHEEYADYF